MIRILVISILVSFLTITFVQAQNAKSDLVVKVLDELGEPLSHARVTVLKKGKIVAYGFTDSTGVRFFSAIDSGLHTVAVQEGMTTIQTLLTLKQGRNELNLEIGIEQLAPLTIEPEAQPLADSYGGSASLEGHPVKSSGRPFARQSLFQRKSNWVMGGVWLSDTRAPTFQNMINMQPND